MNRSLIAFALLAFVAGCGARQPGTLEVRVYGEEYIEEGLPAELFNDGWAVRFTKFQIALSDVKAARGMATADLADPTVRTFDLAQPSGGAGVVVTTARVPGGAYDHTSYRIGSVSIAGTAKKGATTKRFAWDFTRATRFGSCESKAVVDGGTQTIEITVHGDHLFYDDLFSSMPNVSFELVAGADTDMDGDITLAELGAVDLRRQERYQVGSTGITELRSFIEYQIGTIGHIDGEGHCADIERE
jgi:hypothetical protein